MFPAYTESNPPTAPMDVVQTPDDTEIKPMVITKKKT